MRSNLHSILTRLRFIRRFQDYYLENKIRFPFQAKCLAANVVSPLRKVETVKVVRLAPDDVCAHDMLVLVRWQGRNMAVPLAQLTAAGPDE